MLGVCRVAGCWANAPPEAEASTRIIRRRRVVIPVMRGILLRQQLPGALGPLALVGGSAGAAALLLALAEGPVSVRAAALVNAAVRAADGPQFKLPAGPKFKTNLTLEIDGRGIDATGYRPITVTIATRDGKPVNRALRAYLRERTKRRTG